MRLRWIAVPVLAASAVSYCTLRPVCVPLSQEQLAQFNSPIAERDDRDFYLHVFQQRDGRWFQCKTWLSRKMFF